MARGVTNYDLLADQVFRILDQAFRLIRLQNHFRSVRGRKVFSLYAVEGLELPRRHRQAADHGGRRGLPERYQLYLSLYRGPYARFVGYSAQLDAHSGSPVELLELAYPPYSCVLSLNGEVRIETTNISEFAQLAIDESCIVDLDLLNGFGHTPFPADFRTLAAVERDREADRRAA